MAGFLIKAGAVQDALAEIIAERLDAEGVPSCVGYPQGGPQEEHVWMEGGFEVAVRFIVSGGRTRKETSQLKIKTLITRAADDVVELRDRALVLAALIEAAVVDNETLGGLVERLWVGGAQASEGVTEDGRRQYGLTLTVSYEVSVSRTA